MLNSLRRSGSHHTRRMTGMGRVGERARRRRYSFPTLISLDFRKGRCGVIGFGWRRRLSRIRSYRRWRRRELNAGVDILWLRGRENQGDFLRGESDRRVWCSVEWFRWVCLCYCWQCIPVIMLVFEAKPKNSFGLLILIHRLP